jgi:hypothetical protein
VGSGAKYLLLSTAGGEILDSEFPGFGNSVRCVKFQDRFNEDFESDFGWE